MLKMKIAQIFKEHHGRYGSPRIHDELKKQGILVGRKRIEKLMRELGLVACSKKRFKVVTTDSNHSFRVFSNLLDRYFQASAPNQVWTGDITYIRTDESWLYLAVVIDLYSRKVVGWSMGAEITSQLANDALLMAITNRKPSAGLIFHSDRGSQYASHLFRNTIEKYHFQQSMSRKGDCWDNAPTESFFATLKKELIRGYIYSTRREAITDIFQYLEGYYNIKRNHSFLGYMTPAEFEMRMVA
jgi:transposase InsO family protein